MKCRIKDEVDYLRKLLKKLENVKCEEYNDDKPRKARHQGERKCQLVEMIDYLERRDEFWKFIN